MNDNYIISRQTLQNIQSMKINDVTQNEENRLENNS